MLIHGITLIILSLVAVPSLILSKKPNAKELLDKAAPYQGWAGVVFCVWGIWGIISCFLMLGMLGYGVIGIIAWVTCFAVSLAETLLGFMLGYGLIYKYALSKNETTKLKGEQALAKIKPMEGKIGIFGLIVGAWCIVLYFIYIAAIAAL